MNNYLDLTSHHITWIAKNKNCKLNKIQIEIQLEFFKGLSWP